MFIYVKVTPRSKLNKVRLVFKDNQFLFRIHTTEIPEDGKANRSVKKLLSQFLELKTNTINLVSGHTSTIKVFEIPTQAEILMELVEEKPLL